MKMDGRDSVECQNWEKKGQMVILEFVLNELNDKIVNGDHLLPLNPRENVKKENELR